MRKLLIYWIALMTLLAAGCSSTEEKRDRDLERRRDQKASLWTKWSIVYQPEVQQGNIINQEMVNKLSPGMDRRQVQFILGTPLLVDGIRGDSLKRPPRGFDPEHKHIEDLKKKSFYIATEVPAGAALHADFIDRVTEGFRLSAPMVRFINDALELPY